MLVSDEHLLNAPAQIDVTLFGIVMFVSDEHPSNAQPPIDVTPLGILPVSSPDISLPVGISIIHLDSFLKCVFSGAMLILLIGISANGLAPILVTLLGIVMLVSDEHP